MLETGWGGGVIGGTGGKAKREGWVDPACVEIGTRNIFESGYI